MVCSHKRLSAIPTKHISLAIQASATVREAYWGKTMREIGFESPCWLAMVTKTKLKSDERPSIQ